MGLWCVPKRCTTSEQGSVTHTWADTFPKGALCLLYHFCSIVLHFFDRLWLRSSVFSQKAENIWIYRHTPRYYGAAKQASSAYCRQRPASAHINETKTKTPVWAKSGQDWTASVVQAQWLDTFQSTWKGSLKVGNIILYEQLPICSLWTWVLLYALPHLQWFPLWSLSMLSCKVLEIFSKADICFGLTAISDLTQGSVYRHAEFAVWFISLPWNSRVLLNGLWQWFLFHSSLLIPFWCHHLVVNSESLGPEIILVANSGEFRSMGSGCTAQRQWGERQHKGTLSLPDS